MTDDVQVADAVRSCVLALVYVPVAVNCCVLPSGTDALAGVTEMETRVGAVIVSVVDPVIVPDVAVMVVEP